MDWQRRSSLWDYLWQLAKCSKAGRDLDPTELGAEASPEAAVKQKSRLVGLPGFPSDLAARIQRTGRGAQRLDVPREQIRRFEVVTQEVVREWTG